MSKKDFEKKYIKLKEKYKLMKDVLKAAIKILEEANKEKKDLLEKKDIHVDTGKAWEKVMRGAEEEKEKAENKVVSIVLEPECLWLSEILASTNNLKIKLVSKFFVGQLGIRDIRAKEIISAKPETDGKDGKWVVLYTPFEEPKEGINMVVGGKVTHIPASISS